jgi:hypothetical protein
VSEFLLFLFLSYKLVFVSKMGVMIYKESGTCLFILGFWQLLWINIKKNIKNTD